MSSNLLAKIPQVDDYSTSSSKDDSKNERLLNIGIDGLPTVGSMLTEEVKREKITTWKNVLIITLSFTFLFIAVSVASILQSTLNSENGLGVTSQATIHIAQIVSSMFIPTWMIQKIELKWTMVISQICQSTYIAAQFYPTFYTLIPTAILLGLASAPLWSAQSTYMTRAGVRYAALIGEEDVEPSISKFFGAFGMGLSTSMIWGSLINSAVFSMGSTSNKTETTYNSTITNMNCGADFCFSEFLARNKSDQNMFNASKPSKESVDILFGALLAFSLSASVILAIFLDRPLKVKKDPGYIPNSGWKLLIATFQQTKNINQILIIPLTFYSGFSMAFLTADFTAAFIVCTTDVVNIGFMMVIYGVVGSVFSFIFGVLVKWIGRQPIFLFGCALSLALLIALLMWTPVASQLEIFYLVSSLWALTFSVWQTQLNSLYGVIFCKNKESAFANFRLWQSLGFATAFATTTVLCVSTRIYMMIGFIICGTTGYIAIEVIEWKKQSK